MSPPSASSRTGSASRETRETSIHLELVLDEPSVPRVQVDLPFLGHMLEAMAVHGGLGLEIRAGGDVEVDPHHLLEDTGICLGRALREGVGPGGGSAIGRIGHSVVPMDGSLSSCSVDLLCGRPNLVWMAGFAGGILPGACRPAEYRHFFKGFVDGSGSTLHLRVLYWDDVHHGLESLFKAFGRSLAQALEPMPGGRLASSKGVIDG